VITERKFIEAWRITPQAATLGTNKSTAKTEMKSTSKSMVDYEHSLHHRAGSSLLSRN
jgi:hypothetical protein